MCNAKTNWKILLTCVAFSEEYSLKYIEVRISELYRSTSDFNIYYVSSAERSTYNSFISTIFISVIFGALRNVMFNFCIRQF